MFTRIRVDKKTVEPSRMCLEEPLSSLSTVQGVFLWTAINALWLHRCDVQFGRQSKDVKKFMAQWHSVLEGWGKWEDVDVDKRQTKRLQQAIKAWMMQ